MAFIDRDSLTIVTRKNKYRRKEKPYCIATIKCYLPAQEAKSNPQITPILGQFKVNSMDFLKKFNQLSLIYALGIPLGVKLYKFSDDSINIVLNLPSFYILLLIALGEPENMIYRISKLLLFDLIKIEAIKLNKSLSETAKIVFGILGSTNIVKCY